MNRTLRTNLKHVQRRSALPDAVLHTIDALVDQPADLARDRRALVVVCADGLETNVALERLATWRRLFGGSGER
ncbi:MAG TPA: hypothetical protein PK402_06585 [Tepidisphaeraceae bacterium]|nr:hypothetical protein [Tepidisphaeraceae bacterium]